MDAHFQLFHLFCCTLMADYFQRQVRQVEWGPFNPRSLEDILGRLIAAIVQNDKKDTTLLQPQWVDVVEQFD